MAQRTTPSCGSGLYIIECSSEYGGAVRMSNTEYREAHDNDYKYNNVVAHLSLQDTANYDDANDDDVGDVYGMTSRTATMPATTLTTRAMTPIQMLLQQHREAEEVELVLHTARRCSWRCRPNR
jgi:hypothetical protein